MSKFVQHKNYVHPPRNPALVPPPEINVWKLPEYVPAKNEVARAGANDNLKYFSKGGMT